MQTISSGPFSFLSLQFKIRSALQPHLQPQLARSHEASTTCISGEWRRLTFFFLLDGAHRGEDTTVAIHRIAKKRGCPTRRAYAWEVCILPSQSIWSADKNWEQRDQKPHAETRRVGHPIRPPLSVRA